MSNGFLLDSNALIWSFGDSFELGKRTRAIVSGITATYFSSITVAEIEIKQTLGKIRLPKDFNDRLNSQYSHELAFTRVDAEAIGRFGQLAHHDPFDRLIVAQAAARGLTLITSDRRLLSLGFGWILDARS